MKAITLWQPYASLISVGAKRFETRGFETKHRGTIVIHASKTFPDVGKALARQAYVAGCLQKAGIMSFSEIPLGAIVGVGTLVETYRTNDPFLQDSLTVRERHVGDFSEGRFAWQIDDVRFFTEPYKVSGAQGLWDVPAAAVNWIKANL